MKSDFKFLKLDIYGESHAPEIGVRIDGIPSGIELSLDCVNNLLERRRSHGEVWATPRKEGDEPVILAGLDRCDGGYVTTGDTIDVCIKNTNVRPKDYENISTVPRPSHADFAAYAKEGRIASGGGRFSGRMTAPLCIAGGIAQEILSSLDIQICAYISQIGEATGKSYKTDKSVSLFGLDRATQDRIKSSSFPLIDDSDGEALKNQILLASREGDSVGGVVECVVNGLEAGLLGDALFCGLEGKIASAVYAVPAVKGVEFGSGFDLAGMRGSTANDSFVIRDGRVATATNNSGGINGGISNGMPLTLRVAIKPTPSISKAQRSVDLADMTECELKIKGRHDACIVPRAVPCIESAVALALLDGCLQIRDGIQLFAKQ